MDPIYQGLSEGDSVIEYELGEIQIDGGSLVILEGSMFSELIELITKHCDFKEIDSELKTLIMNPIGVLPYYPKSIRGAISIDMGGDGTVKITAQEKVHKHRVPDEHLDREVEDPHCYNIETQSLHFEKQ